MLSAFLQEKTPEPPQHPRASAEHPPSTPEPPQSSPKLSKRFPGPPQQGGADENGYMESGPEPDYTRPSQVDGEVLPKCLQYRSCSYY